MKIWSNALIVSQIIFVLATGCKGGTQNVGYEVSNNSENATPVVSKAEEKMPSQNKSPTALPATTPDPKLPKRNPQSAPLDVFQQAKQLGRGVNLGNALEAPSEGQWGVILQESYFKTIKDAEFETVRVPIKWSAHSEAEAPYAIDALFVERIDWVIDQALKQGLNVVLDMHNFDEIYPNPDEQEARFLALWKQISARYKDLPGNVYFELLNEPHGSLTWSKWNRMLKKALDTIRSEDQWHTVIIGSVNWSNYADLASLDIPDNEQNVIVTFHYYDPFLFTHQGAEWGGPEVGTMGVTWPGPPAQIVEPIAAAKQVQWVNDWFEDYNTQPVETNPAGPQSIVEAFDKVDNWAKEHHRPIYLGEFGAYSKADMPSRARWTTFVREEADKRGFSWAYWEFSSGFGVYDPIANQFRNELLEALLPNK